MVKRVPQSSDVDAATAAFKRISLGSSPTQLRTPSGGALHRHGSILPSGMAARRNKPLFKLSDIMGESGGGAAGAGPVALVPDDAAWPARLSPAATDTPFSNFGRIVYAFLVLTYMHSTHPLPLGSDPSGALNFSGKAILHSSGVDFSNGPSFAINMDQLQLGEELGNGAYGTVKRVLHKPTNVAMAMKVRALSTLSFTTVDLTCYLSFRKFG
jgi:mitogen-activated protein kinase kinase